jgi:hypothetical protein
MTVNGACVLIPALVPWHDGVAVMRTMPAPAGRTGSRWQQACLDATLLLDTHGAELLALGWSAADVFGLYPQAPGAVDVFGLALLLDGGTVAELTGDGATILRPSGARLTIRRGSRRPAAPVWR